MPNIKSAAKRLKTNEKARLRHKSRRSALKTLEKKLCGAVKASQSEKTKELLSSFYVAMDKCVKAGTIHRNKANRKKSQLAKQVAVSNAKA